MNFEPDDPRLTAYALGELDGADLREMEAHLMEDPAARRVVDEIRASAAMLKCGFGQETVAGLTDKQRAAIGASNKVVRMHAKTEVSKAASRGWKFGWPVALGGMAALVTLGVLTFVSNSPESKLSPLGYDADARKTPSRTTTTNPDDVVVNTESPLPIQPADSARAREKVAELGDKFETQNLKQPDTQSAFAANEAWQRKRGPSAPENKPLGVLQKEAAAAASQEPTKKEQPLVTPKETHREREPAASTSEALKNPVAPVVVVDERQAEVKPLPENVTRKSNIRAGEVDDDGFVDVVIRPEVKKPEERFKAELTQDDYRKERNPARKKWIAEQLAKEAALKRQVPPTENIDNPVTTKVAPKVEDEEGFGRVGIDVRKKESFTFTGQYQIDDEKVAARPDPNQPLNPLGYAERPPQKPQWQDDLRYTDRYRSYIPPVYQLPASGEEYARINDNTFLDTGVLEHRLSTFSADVDTASYSNVRRFLNQGQLPPADAVRVEEMVNYFKYDYTAPSNGKPFNVFMEVARCPWNANHKLARIGIKAVELTNAQRPASNLVFLIDVSGSMDGPTRLPLVKSGLAELVKKMDANDRVSIVTYADGARLVLGPTPCNEQRRILEVIDSLKASGSTNGGEGIQQAYTLAQNNKIGGGVNRVILATDGDFNVGITDKEQLTRFIEGHAKNGIFLTVLGYGMGNIKDATLEQLANRGNGNYAYIDDAQESQRVLVDQMSGTLVTVAKDVKLQIEFNPARVRAHRLIGYENRKLAHADFKNDSKDAGEIGAGHTVTALYEIVPTRSGAALPNVDPLKYLPVDEALANSKDELLTLKVRYKLHNQDTSNLLEFPIIDQAQEYTQATQDFKFAASVAAFGMLLRGSPYRGSATFEEVLREASANEKGDKDRREFIELVRRAQAMSGRR